ncbi:malonyl CoA-ACP transacylase [Mycobacterium sp. ITM-2017-0098]|nr:malonyl CoA-ACP transacylase [Mycobacterium sp. ITM-2017-0098]
MSAWAATVGSEIITVAEIDAREREIRAGGNRHALPRPGTSEARQLRRWLTQVLVAERVVAGAAPGASAGPVPAEVEILPDTVARMEVGSVAAATLADRRGRAVYATVTAGVQITDAEVAAYHARNPLRFCRAGSRPGGWSGPPAAADVDAVRTEIATHLLAAARRREYRRWLDAQCARIAVLAEGYEHPGDPRQPDNTHRH